MSCRILNVRRVVESTGICSVCRSHASWACDTRALHPSNGAFTLVLPNPRGEVFDDPAALHIQTKHSFSIARATQIASRHAASQSLFHTCASVPESSAYQQVGVNTISGPVHSFGLSNSDSCWSQPWGTKSRRNDSGNMRSQHMSIDTRTRRPRRVSNMNTGGYSSFGCDISVAGVNTALSACHKFRFVYAPLMSPLASRKYVVL